MNRLTRFEEWRRADVDTRQRALVPLLDDIERRDPEIRAWVRVVPQWPTGDGPLAHIPFGVKDVIETADLATEYGSPLYAGRRSSDDAEIVKRLRARGAVLLGKTQTCAFACRTPAPTRNPRHPGHTPGGSSAGSAAAVAADMVPFTIGTQTHGSVLRPASYCGVTGFKPTYSLISTAGVLPVARTLDTVGFFTHTAAGMCDLWEALGYPLGDAGDVVFAVAEPPLAVDAAMASAFADALDVLRAAGCAITPAPLTQALATMPLENQIVEFYEGARTHEARYREFGDQLNDVAEMVREGLRIPAARYDAALAFIGECREAVAAQLARTPVILTPAATGPAPAGLTSTGDARMNSPWTAIGTPAIAIPLPVAAGSLPLGLQLTAAIGNDGYLLSAAARVADVLGAAGSGRP